MADMYLSIEKIKGDATAKGVEKQIEILSYNVTFVQESGGSHTSGAGHTGGRAKVADFNFTKRLDAASPLLFLTCCTGENVGKAVLTLRRANKDQTVYMTYTFTKCVVSSYHPEGHGGSGDLPTESFSLRYDSLQVEYTPVNSDGKAGAPDKKGYDFALNATM